MLRKSFVIVSTPEENETYGVGSILTPPLNISPLLIVAAPVINKLWVNGSTYDAVLAKVDKLDVIELDALMEFTAHDDVPNTEPVNDKTVIVPDGIEIVPEGVNIIEELTNKLPVIVTGCDRIPIPFAIDALTAYDAVPKSDPVIENVLIEPVTVNDPLIIALPVYGNDEATAALSAYDAVRAYELLTV